VQRPLAGTLSKSGKTIVYSLKAGMYGNGSGVFTVAKILR
jgi:hypothetical protein